MTSQFEQQLRAVCGLPLGSTEQLCPPRWRICSATSGVMASPIGKPLAHSLRVKLHLYGKLQPRPGRKMGHLTALGPDADGLVRRAREALTRR